MFILWLQNVTVRGCTGLTKEPGKWTLRLGDTGIGSYRGEISMLYKCFTQEEGNIYMHRNTHVHVHILFIEAGTNNISS